jgi:hypothetical protein
MRFHEFETVVLQVDMPGHGWKTGDVGAVVQVYSKDAVEVEFVTASGRTQALVMAFVTVSPSSEALACRSRWRSEAWRAV